MDNATITITKAEYDALHAKSLKLDIVERTVRNDSDSAYGYSSNTRAILEAVLGISRNKEKAD